jgi:hypothetical protein
MSPALPIAANLEQLRKQAKDLSRDHHAGPPRQASYAGCGLRNRTVQVVPAKVTAHRRGVVAGQFG